MAPYLARPAGERRRWPWLAAEKQVMNGGEEARRGDSLSEQIWTPPEPEQCRPQKATTNQSTSISSVLVDLKKTKQKKEADPFFLVGFTVKIHISLVPKMEKEK